MDIDTHLGEAISFTTAVTNATDLTITANGTSIPSGGSPSIPSTSTGLSIQVPGIGEIRLFDAGTERANGLKVVSGSYFSYISAPGSTPVQIKIFVGPTNEYVFTIASGGPTAQPVGRPSPDSVFPVASINGDVVHNGVNLFTGDVNQSFPLAAMRDGRLEYGVAAFYNSRSVGIAEPELDNVLRGNGWKLMDYPKIVQEGALTYFLDGYASYLLTPNTAGSFSAGGDYHGWVFNRDSTITPGWLATNDRGISYVLGARGQLATGRTVWHLVAIVDLQNAASVRIKFTYTGNAISSIKNSLGDEIDFHYDTSGTLDRIVSSVGIRSQPKVDAEWMVLFYEETSRRRLMAIRRATMLPTGFLAPVDGGYFFSYNAVEDPQYPLALASFRSPLGAVQTYSYYNGQGVVSGGRAFQDVHPVVRVQNQPDQTSKVATRLVYSFWNWQFDPTQTYAQWNLAQEYTGALYASEDDEDRYGHTSFLFCTGQPASQLHNYSDDPAVAIDRAMLGKVYWSGNFEMVRTDTRSFKDTGRPVGYWPGVTVSLDDLPAGAQVTGVSCKAWIEHPDRADMVLAIENNQKQIRAVYEEIEDMGGQTMEFELHVLGPATNVRAWSCLSDEASMRDLEVTYIVPPNPPSVPPDTRALHAEKVLVSGFLNVIPAAGTTFDLKGSYANATEVTIDFRNKRGGPSHVTVTCLDGGGGRVASETFEASEGHTAIGAVPIPAGAQVARINISATGGSAALNRLELSYLLQGQPVTDDALADGLSSEHNVYAIGRSGAASFAKTVSNTTSKDGVVQTTTTKYGDDYTVPYPKVITQTVVKPDQGGASVSVTRQRQLVYAAEKYSAVGSMAMGSLVAEVLDFATVGDLPSNPPAIAGAVTQWKSWGAKWGEWRQFQLQSPKVTDGFAPTPDASWRAGATVKARSDRGTALVKVSSDSVATSLILDAMYDNWTVATFENADATAGEAGWFGFESYENQKAWSRTGQVVQNQAYTGAAACVSLPSTSARLFPSSFQPRPGASYLVGAYVRLNPGGTCQIGFKTADHWGVNETTSFDPGQPGWRYVQCMTSGPPVAKNFPAIEVVNGAIDHVVFAPTDCNYEASVWDLQRRCRTAIIKPNGSVTHVYYDSSRNPLASAEHSRNLSLVDQSYSSVLGQLWFAGSPSYSDAAPNQALSTRCGSDAVWDDFTSTINPVFPPNKLTNMTRTGNHLMIATASTTPALAQAVIAGASDFAVFAEVLLSPTQPASGQAIGVTVGYANGSDSVLLGLTAGAVALMEVSTGKPLISAPMKQLPPAVVLTLVVRGGTKLHAYADSALLFEHTLATPVTGGCGLRTNVPGAAFYNFGYTARPELSNVTSNADGEQMQYIAASSASSSTISERLFGGDRMLYAGRTVETTHKSSSLAPVAGFATLDANTMTVSGKVTESWPDAYNTSPFADSLEHYPDPVQRRQSHGRAGLYTAGRKGSVNYAYGDNTDGYFSFPKGTLNTTASIGPTGAKIVSYKNPLGMTFGKARIDQASSATLLTGYEYDTAFRLIATYFANAYANPTQVDKTIFYRRNVYNFLNAVTELAESDTGRTAFAYNSMGRRRLLQDAAGAAAVQPYCVYTKYDRLGRVVEEGTWKGAITSVTPAQLDDPTWPPNGDWSRRLTWDSSDGGWAENTIGRVTKIATPSVVQQFSYDRAGRPTVFLTQLAGSDSRMTLGYDGVGRLTSIKEYDEEIEGYDVRYGYDEQGRLTSVGTSQNPVAYASYEYGNGSVTEKLLNGTVTRLYTMNALGDLQSIADDFFKETLFFDTRASGQPGYLNGQIASAKYEFTWDKAPAGYIYEYYYDAFGRLTRADNSANAAWTVGTPTTLVEYDNNGNIQSMNRGGTSITFSYVKGTNRLSDSGPGQGFTYDAKGNVTGSTRLGLSITYDPLWNQVTTAGKVTLTLDGAGRRVIRQDATGQRIYVRDPQGRVLIEKSGASSVRYIYGVRGRVAMVDASGATYALLTDHNLSPRAVVTPDRQVVAWYNFDPFGQMLAEISDPGSIGLRYLYTGQEWDEDLGLYNFVARFYDPFVCRFYSPDPDRQFASPYIYSDNPVSFDDPTGDFFWLALFVIGAAIVGGGLEAAREVVAGEELSAGKIAAGAAVGGAAGALALWTGGGSLAVAATTMGKGIGLGAGIGAGFSAIPAAFDSSNSWKDVGWATLGGAISGAQSGMVSSVVGPAATATYLGEPIAGSAVSAAVESRTRDMLIGATAGAVSGAASGFINAALTTTIQGRDPKTALWDFAGSVVAGAVSGASWRVKFGARAIARNQALPANLVELQPLI